ncbi:Serine carboxypeptidase-like 26 [Linum grandiflorum]
MWPKTTVTALNSFFLIYVTVGFLAIWSKDTEASSGSQESDRIVNLPFQPSSPVLSQFAGYVTTNEEHGRALFYWFFEAETNPSTKPLLLWLNGGPGCSSIGFGAAAELGPLRVGENGDYLYYNKFAWNKEANLLFLESPVGVGFSYTNASSDPTVLNDGLVGHYVPQLAELIHDRNKEARKYPTINLKGVMVGNAEIDDYHDYKGFLEYAWSHSVISDQQYKDAKQECDFTSSDWPGTCNDAMSPVFDSYAEIDIFNIYAPVCITNSSASSSPKKTIQDQARNHGLGRLRMPGGYDPCFTENAEAYFNKADVRLSLHATRTGSSDNKWKGCNPHLLSKYNFSVFSVLPTYAKLINGGLKVWIYSGDADGRVPVIGSRYCVEALGLPLKSPWRSWFHHHQVAGKVVEYKGVTFVTVRGAGHMVPLDKPSEALFLLHSFLFNHSLPAQR